MSDTLRMYLRYVGISIRGQMQYRASFVMSAVAQFVTIATEFLAIWALFDRFGSQKGWSRPEVALFYGIVNIAFSLAETIGRGFDTFPAVVKAGDFDRLLVRPRSTALQVAGREFQLRGGRLAQGILVLAWAVTAVGVNWTVARAGLLLATIAGGTCVFLGLFVLQATLSFWTIETLEIMNTVTYGGTETAQYPLDIYRTWFRRFFTFVVPLACVSYLPALAILGRPSPAGTPEALLWLAPLVGVAFLAIALRAWRFGEKHYLSTGS